MSCKFIENGKETLIANVLQLLVVALQSLPLTKDEVNVF